MNHSLLPAFFLASFLCSCGAVKSVGHGAKWTYQKAAAGVHGAGSMVKSGTQKIWPFGKSDEKKTAAETKAKAPPPPERVAPVPAYDATKFWVRDADLGENKKTAVNASETLKEGWEVSGASLAFAVEYPGTPPNQLRAEGSPARATRQGEGRRMEVTAQQIHYRQSTGWMVLKGNPTVVVGNHRITAQSPATLIVISLQDGSFQAIGPIKTISFSR